MRGTYQFYVQDGTAFFTCYQGDAAARAKGWRSLGCFSCPEADVAANVAALQRDGYTPEHRSAYEMAQALFTKQGA